MDTLRERPNIRLIASRKFSRWILDAARLTRRQPVGAIGLLILLLLAIFAVFAQWVAPYGPYDPPDSARLMASPSREFWLGTDQLGRDLFSRIVHGSRITFTVALFSVVIGSVLGTVIGVTSGYLGGLWDVVAQRVIDAMMVFPLLILSLAIVAILGPGLKNVVLAVSIALVPRVARVARSGVFSVRNEPYVEAIAAVGATSRRIMALHILPNILAPIIVIVTAQVGTAILAEAAISFLGAGIQPPEPSWGTMLNDGRLRMFSAPWLGLFPGLAISLVVLAVNLLGDTLRDELDPRLRGSR